MSTMLLFYGIVKAITEKKLLKIGLFSIKTFIGISVFVMLLHFLHLASFKIYFSFCFWSTSIKLKLPLSLHLFSIAKMLGWFPYFKIHSMGYWPPPSPAKVTPPVLKFFTTSPSHPQTFTPPSHWKWLLQHFSFTHGYFQQAHVHISEPSQKMCEILPRISSQLVIIF